MRLRAITGMTSEARIAERAGIEAMASGGVAATTEMLIRDADRLISFGIAGALAPRLVPGTLLLPHDVIDENGARYPIDAAWRSRVLAALRSAGLVAEEGTLIGTSEAAASVTQKAGLFARTGAIAVDLESHIVARAAKPFLVLRAVADPASRDLPPAALVGLAPSGAPAIGAVLVSLAWDPTQLPALLRLAGDSRRALSALGSALAQGAVRDALASGGDA